MSGQDRLAATVQLLRRWKDGDPEAADHLYRRYFDRIHAVVRLRMGQRLRAKAESADIVQEAFLASLRGLGNFSYRDEGDFFHWLCKITENRIRDEAGRFAAQKRDMARERPLEGPRPSADSVYGPIHDVARWTTPGTQLVRAEQLEQLERAIDDLPEVQREALLLVRYEGLSLKQAGQIMHRSADAVRMLVARAIVALAKRLGAEPAPG